MTLQEAHLRVLASAGSGKTYRLVERYVALLEAGAPPQRILATTFTRAAAGEVQRRVLKRLLDESQRNDDPDRARRMRTLLSDVARNMHLLRIRTLDSFFASVVRAYAFELGVSPRAAVADEALTREIRLEAVRRIFTAHDDGVIETLRNLLMGKTSAGISRSAERVLMSLEEEVGAAAPEAWEMIPAMKGLEPAELAEAVETLAGLSEQDIQAGHKSAITSWQSDVATAREGDWIAFIGKGIAKKILEDAQEYYQRPLLPELVEVYEPLIRHAKATVVALRRFQNAATRDLVARFRIALAEIKKERGLLFFEDFTRLMFGAIGPDRRSEEIGYRLDGAIEHMMLDEFQDTSDAQFRALMPLLHELVADETRGRTTFVVGDLKQSIYGWRGGDAELLANLPVLLMPGNEGSIDHAAAEEIIRTERLDMSWRSSPVILETVDTVFDGIGRRDLFDEDVHAAMEFETWYQPHTARHAELPGYAALHVLPASGSGRGSSQMHALRRAEMAARLVAELHEAAPDRSIGVLVRTRKGAERVLQALRTLRPDIEVAGTVDVPVTDSHAANAILDMLRLVERPDDRVSAFNVEHSPLGAWLNLKPLSNSIDRARCANRLRARIVRDGLARTLTDAVRTLLPTCGVRDRRRLEHLLQLAERPAERPGLDIAGFIRRAEATRVGDVAEVKVNVMTVHRSKGLEFDAVILPELAGSMRGRGTSEILVERAGLAGAITGVTRWVSEKELPLMPDRVLDLHRQHHRRAVREALCLLYVALTRAKTRLHMVIDAQKEGTRRISADRLLAAQLGDQPDSSGLAWSRGDEAAWGRRTPEQTREEEVVIRRSEAPRLAPPSGARPSARTAVAASGLFESSRRLADRYFLGKPDAAWFGTIVHRMFEEIEWLEDALPDENLLRAAAMHAVRHLRAEARGGDPADLVPEALRMVQEALRDSDIRELFQKPDGPALLLREWPFVRARDGGRLQQGLIDRLVIRRSTDGRARSADIIDFKTDRCEDDAAHQAAIHHHAPQMHAYRETVAESFGLSVDAIAVHLLFVRSGRVLGV